MQKDILVSVVIPTYSRNFTLKRAIDCVLAQTHQKLEIIVVDDNPPESEWRKCSERIMQKYTKDPRVLYIQNEYNMGGGLTRNQGIKQAKGKYVSFLDDDDEYLPERIEKMLKVFEESRNEKLALVYCYAKFINQDGSSTYSDTRNFHGNCLYEAMVQNCIAATSQWMVKKSVLDEVDGFPDVPCKQDSQTILRMLNAGYEVEVVPEELSVYHAYVIGEKISGAEPKNILGENLYRTECRKLYYLLEDWQILNIEYTFAEKLYHIYIHGKDRSKRKHQWKIMKRLNPEAAYLFQLKRIWHGIKRQ